MSEIQQRCTHVTDNIRWMLVSINTLSIQIQMPFLVIQLINFKSLRFLAIIQPQIQPHILTTRLADIHWTRPQKSSETPRTLMTQNAAMSFCILKSWAIICQSLWTNLDGTVMVADCWFETAETNDCNKIWVYCLKIKWSANLIGFVKINCDLF